MKLPENIYDDIKAKIKEGYIRQADHPYYDLSIYNYTPKTQYEENWTYSTSICRGLVLNKNRDIIIQCIPKFFNLNEPLSVKVNLNNARILEKADGYLIQIKVDSDYGLIITSRGSFDNKYIEAAKKFITDEVIYKMIPDYIYFCELLQNFPGDEAIILTKHPEPKLVCWAVKDKDFNEIVLDEAECPFPIVKELSLAEAKEYLKQKVEGIVAQDLKTKERVKLKTSFYLEMHRLISQCTPFRAWEIVSTGRNITELNIPDEFMPRMKEWSESLQHQFDTQYQEVIIQSKKYSKLSDKALGLRDIPQPLKSYIFLVRKNKNSQLESLIWKNIRPKGT